MKFPSPLYFLFGLLLCAGLATANHRGWSLIAAVASRTWQHVTPGTQHK